MLAFLKKYFKKEKVVKDYFINCNVDNQFVFIHIPKNAGTSIATALSFEQTSHATIQEVQIKLSKSDFDAYYKFCFVRNPWDRFLSLYNYARLEESLHHSAIHPEKAKYGKHTDYELLKNASLEQCAEYLIAGQLKHDPYWNHWQPQVNWITDQKSEILVDFVGRVESIEIDFAHICRKLNTHFVVPNRVNTSANANSNYQKYYNAKTRDLIGEYYKADVQLFDYKF